MISLIIVFVSLVLHEIGHCFAAYAFGVKINKLSLFFDPFFSLFRTRCKNGTEFSIGWLPLGAYVLFEDDEVKYPNQSITSKEPWKRILIYLSGIFINFIVCYICCFGYVRYYVDIMNTKTTSKHIDFTNRIIAETAINCYENVIPVKEKSVKHKLEKPVKRHDVKGSTEHHDKNKSVKGQYILWTFVEVNLFLMLFNLLPIPPLDGGQCLCHLYELVTGKRPNQNLCALLGFFFLTLILGIIFVNELWIIYNFIRI